MMWLLEHSLFTAMKVAFADTANRPSLEQHASYDARFSDDDGNPTSRILTSAGDTSQIKVTGVLTKSPSWMAYLFGGGNTTYTEIAAALAQADADTSTKKIEMLIDSGGGQFDGLFDAIAAMQNTEKEIHVISTGLTASAAYALASQGDTITASGKASRIGSIGVVATFGVSDDEVQITSTNAPKKRPDVKTPEGVAMVKEELDAMHELFVDAIAEGRGVSSEKINADFGQGATLLAEEALSQGMIDAISGTESTKSNSTANNGGGNQEVNSMNLQELKAQHPAAYAEAVAVGHENGVTAERDRAAAHLTMGEASGAMDVAIAAVSDGSEMTANLNAKYMAAGIKNQTLAAIASDEPEPGKPEAPAIGAAAADAESDKVFALVTGKEPE